MLARADTSLASLVTFHGENASAVASLGNFLGPVIAFAKEVPAVQNSIYKQRTVASCCSSSALLGGGCSSFRLTASLPLLLFLQTHGPK